MSPSTLLETAADAEPAVLFWSLAGALVLLAVFAAWAEHRRGRRRDLDSVGWVSWNLVQILAFLGAVGAAVLALKS
jgi:membrane protease YdiL (CAAX protease family)